MDCQQCHSVKPEWLLRGNHHSDGAASQFIRSGYALPPWPNCLSLTTSSSSRKQIDKALYEQARITNGGILS